MPAEPVAAAAEAASGAPKRPRSSRRPSAAVLLAAALGLAIGDGARPPSEQLGVRVATGGIDLYRATVSPWLARAGLARCRFEPSCSRYAREATTRYGLPRGVWLASRRLLRCHPWAKGGLDPVP